MGHRIHLRFHLMINAVGTKKKKKTHYFYGRVQFFQMEPCERFRGEIVLIPHIHLKIDMPCVTIFFTVKKYSDYNDTRLPHIYKHTSV